MEVASLFATLGLKPDTASWKQGDRLLSAAKKALAAVAAYKAFGWAKGMVAGVVALGGKLNDLSATVGVNVEALQELGYAAQQNGSSLEGMGTSLRFLGRNMEAAKKGGGEVAKTFRKAGISLKDASGKMLPVEEVLNRVSDAMAKAKSPAEATKIATDLLGRSAATLAPTLAKGSKELTRLREEARATGGVIDRDGIDKLDNLGDSVDRAKFAIQGLKNRAVVALAPAFNAAVDGITTWIAANKVMLNTLGSGVLKTFSFVLKGVAIALKAVAAVFDWLGKHPKVAKALLISIGIVLGVIVAKFALMWLAGKAVIAGIILLVTALQFILKPVVEFLVSAFAQIWKWAKVIGAGLVSMFRRIGTWVTAVVGAFMRIKNKAIEIGASIINAFEVAWEYAKTKAKEAGEFIINLPVIKQLRELGSFIGGALGDIANPEGVIIEGAKPKEDRTGVENALNFLTGGKLDQRDKLIEAARAVTFQQQERMRAGPVKIENNITMVGSAATPAAVQTAASNGTEAGLRDAYAAVR